MVVQGETAPLPALPAGVVLRNMAVDVSTSKVVPFDLSATNSNRNIRIATSVFENANAGKGNSAWDIVIQHATGVPKETYYPLVSYLFNVLGSSNIRSIALHDVRNHGDSAMLNAGLLPAGEQLKEGGWNWTIDAKTDLMAVLAALGLDKSPRLLGIGHSFGGAVLAFAQVERPGKPYFHSLVLVEAIIFPRYPPTSGIPAAPAATPAPTTAVTANGVPVSLSPASQMPAAPPVPKGILNAAARRSTFPSPQAAKSAYATRPFFKSWHPACLDEYIEHGLRPLPSGEWELKTTPEQEAATFGGGRDRVIPLWHKLGEIECPVLVLAGRASHHRGMVFDIGGGQNVWVASDESEPTTEHATSLY